MRKYLAPIGLILCLSLGAAFAQTLTRALQLSQDTTGAFSVDTTNGVYFPGHILSTGTANRPTTVLGTGTPTLSGTDFAGTVTMGTSGQTATVTFGQAYVSVPNCTVSWQNLQSSVSPTSYQVTTGVISMTQGAFTGSKINYFCSSAN
jgi:hypothetical protein